MEFYSGKTKDDISKLAVRWFIQKVETILEVDGTVTHDSRIELR